MRATITMGEKMMAAALVTIMSFSGAFLTVSTVTRAHAVQQSRSHNATPITPVANHSIVRSEAHAHPTSTHKYPHGYPMVAFGDSTMALAPTSRNATRNVNKCQHSVGNWPSQLSHQLKLPLADMSCSGATSKLYSFLEKKYLGSKTKLVVVSYGSNDMRVLDQLHLDNSMPGTHPVYVDHENPSRVEDRLVDILRDIRHRAPNATIITVGYLPLIEGLQCDALPNMTPMEMHHVRSLRETANSILARATIRVADGKTINMSFSHVSGHSLCADSNNRFILNSNDMGVKYHYTHGGIAFISQHAADVYKCGASAWNNSHRQNSIGATSTMSAQLPSIDPAPFYSHQLEPFVRLN